MANKEDVMQVLRKIDDPELRKPLTDLDMIKSVEVDGGTVKVEVSLTVPDCPMKKKITDDIAKQVGKLEGVEKVDVTLGVMSDEQRKNLASKVYGRPPQKPTEIAKEPGPVAGDFANRVIGIASGKGGVGKSTITANLALALSRMGKKVGILDADVYGFSIPRILGVGGQPTAIDDHIIPHRKENIQIMSIGFFLDENTPVIWRGPLLHKTVNQFINDVYWDKLDYFLIDLPPGTGDVTISIAQALPMAEMLVVTTPQPMASYTAGRVAGMAKQTKLAVLGVVENMSYYEVKGERDYIFGKDGGRNLAKMLEVPFLGEIPIRTEIRKAADNGDTEAVANNKDIAAYYDQVAQQIINSGK